MIEIKMVEQIASLAHLSFTLEEAQKLQQDLDHILDHVKQLIECDTTSIEPTVHPLPLVNIFREDNIESSLDRSIVMNLSPDQESAKEGFFAVPSILEDLTSSE